ncbi:uncharacterized protein [Centruroides vittatus]|uniref:uncharacterized protein n=1 Tax=Centruroides vittatus TaxID=120091 RepID=UPI0035106480
MKKIILFSLFVCIFYCTDAETLLTYNCNEAFDMLINAAKNDYDDKLEPYHLPDYKVLFKQKVIATINGQLNLTNGKIYGLKSIHRDKNCEIRVTKEDIYIFVNLTTGQLRWNYDIHINPFITLRFPPFTMEGRVESVFAEIIVNTKQKEMNVTNLKIRKMKNVTIKTNFNPLSIFLNFLQKIILKFFQTKFVTGLENIFKTIINDEINKLAYAKNVTLAIIPPSF